MDIRVETISKTYAGAAAALDGVNFTVGSGELVALLGPSGSGKTTLLRVIAGLEQPDTGAVWFGDIDASRLSVQQRRVGFVFQHYALFRHMTVLDNIAYGLRVRPRSERPVPAEIRKRSLDLLELVQLEGLEGRYPAQLSGGQRQRVALARALAVEPRVLLLDEPFGALDAKVRKELRRWLRDIHDRTGHTTIFVTHDQEEALELADRVAVLDKGRIAQLGTTDEIYDRPVSPMVFRFVGESSVLPVDVKAGEAFVGGEPIGFKTNGAAPGAAELFVRPQHLTLLGPGGKGLPVEVIAVRRAAATRRAEVRVPGNLETLEIDVPHDLAIEPGAWLSLNVSSGRLFPKT